MSLFWGGLFVLFYSFIFLLFGEVIICLFIDVLEVIEMVIDYLFWVIILFIVVMGCFLFDGVFVGLICVKDMCNIMLFSVVVGFFGLFWLVSSW